MLAKKPIYNYDLEQCNQAEMYGEHMEFDSLHFHYSTCRMTSMEIKSLFQRDFCRLCRQ